ncbi:hypothetical protein ABEB36_007599 [Hypothenemus hampei]|uniref:Odorant receptor n=1 Tax=Hypothenemus hampei TaxID=57062 RepID=A0ABD1EYI4_HYPHA
MKSLIKLPKLFMIFVGVWPSKFVLNQHTRRIYNVYRISFVAIFILFYMSLATECLLLITNSSQTERANSASSILISVSIGAIINFTYYINELALMYELIATVEMEVFNMKYDNDIRRSYENTLKYAKYLYTSIIIPSAFSVITYTVTAFAELKTVGYSGWDFNKKSFMYELYIPVDKFKYFNWIILFNLYVGFVCVALHVVYHIMFYGLVVFAAEQLKSIQIRIRKFDKIAHEANVDSHSIIKRFVVDHQDLLKFVNSLNQKVKFPILLEFCVQSFTAASVLFQIITTRSAADLVFPSIFILIVSLEILALGWTSNEIKIQSLSIGDAIYESLWYKQDEYTKKLLLIMVTQAQKPLSLTIGPFQPMTTDTIIFTAKASYSYLTLMKNLLKKY